MIAHCFINRGGFLLDYHLRAYSSFCDTIAVVLDRSPENEATCRQYGAEVIHWTPPVERPDHDENGLLCDEGVMRQLAFDAVAKHKPDYVVFGDTDEAPTPDIAEFLASKPDNADVWYADWVNLVFNIRSAIGGPNSRWSYQRRENNKKGLILRYQPGRQYTYRQALQHVRMEPSPVLEGKTVIDDAHRLLDRPKLLHYKYAAWAKWQANSQSKSAGYLDLLKDAEIVPVWADWLWPYPIPELGYEGGADQI